MPSTLEEQIEQLKSTIAEIESKRETLGDEFVDASLLPFQRRMKELKSLLAARHEAPAAEPAQQRKLVTLLFMDIAGSTSIVQHMDPEDVAEVFDTALKKLATPVEAHGGRVTRFMGDGFLSVFGAPIAREDDPEQAVRAGLQIITAAQELAPKLEEEWDISDFQVRVGINTGLVLLGGQTEAEDTLMGAAVNLAARLESAAPPGGILISHNTYRHIRGVFDVEPLELIHAKGFDQPVPAYRVLHARPRAFRLHTRGVEGIETRMVGRETELKYLQDALLTTIEEGEGQMVTVVGEAGVGKSRLLYEFQDWIELLSHQVRYFEGRAHQETPGLPYGLLRDLFAFRFQIQDNEQISASRELIETGFGEVFGSDQDGEMRAHILGQLLGYDFSTSPHLKGVLDDPQQLHQRALTYLDEYFHALSKSYPAVLLCEDIHWADNSSLDVLSRLGEHATDKRLLIVFAARPILFERRPYWGEGLASHRRIELLPLSRRESRQLVEEILRLAQEIPTELHELVVEGAEGNPFYAEELIKVLIENEVILTGDEAWHVQPDRLAHIEVPPTLAGVLQARLDSLLPDELALLQQGSVVGRLFWDNALERLNTWASGAVHVEKIPDTLSALRSKEMVFRREASSFPGIGEYIFKHSVLRDVTYESVLKRLRRKYHGLVAEWLIDNSGDRMSEYAGIIAKHLELSGQISLAIPYLRQAGDQAVKQYANKEAIEYYRRALRIMAEQSSRDKITDESLSQINESLGDIYRSIGQHEQAREAFQNAFTSLPAEDHLRRAHLKRKLGRVSQDQGKYETSFQIFAEAEMLLGQLSAESGPEWWQEWLWLQIDQLQGYYALAQPDKIAELVKKVQPVVEQYGTLQQHAEFYSGQVRMYFRRDRYVITEELLTARQKLFSIALEIGDKQRVGEAHFELGFTLLWHGDYPKAENELLRGLELAEQCSNLYNRTLCLTYLSICYRLLGRIEEVKTYISRSIEAANERQMFNYIATARANQAWVAWREGNLIEVESNGNAALDIWGQYPYFHYPFLWTALWPLIAVAVECEQLDKAAGYAEALLKPDQQRLPEEITATLESAINAWHRDQQDLAHQGLKKALELAQKIGHL